MAFSSGVVRGDELHAHGFGLLGEVVQDPLAVLFCGYCAPHRGDYAHVSGRRATEDAHKGMGNPAVAATAPREQ